jgi:hypothetical protein
MKIKQRSFSIVFGLTALLIIAAGCGRNTKSSTGSVASAGRQITWSVDGPASIAATDPLIIKFGNHKLERQGGNFVLDGRNIGGIGGTDRIDIVVSNSILRLTSGKTSLTIPVTQ